LFKRGRTSAAAAPATAQSAATSRPHRVLVIGGRGFNADVCVNWDDPRANVTDFDSAVVITPTEEPPGDIQRRYREDLLQLLLTGGTIYVVATPYDTWPGEGRRAILPVANYDWCPVPIRVDDRRGESIESVDSSVAWLFAPVHSWSSTITVYQRGPQHGFMGNEDVAVLPEFEALATNRAEEALALRVRLQIFRMQNDGFMHRQLAPTPIGRTGWAYVLPAHTPWHADNLAAHVLATFLDRTAGTPKPEWLTDSLLPPTPDEDRAPAGVGGRPAPDR
jgi:hypothetical protein